MKADVKPPCPTRKVHIDKYVRYVFRKTGPSLMGLHTVKKQNNLRRVGNLYYTYDFACAFLRAAASGNVSLMKIYTELLSSCTRHNGQLASLLPRATNGFWMNVLEDLLHAPPLTEYRENLLAECKDHAEFQYLSIGEPEDHWSIQSPFVSVVT